MGRRWREVRSRLPKALGTSLLLALPPTALLALGLFTVADAPPVTDWASRRSVPGAVAAFFALGLAMHFVPRVAGSSGNGPLLLATQVLVAIQIVIQFRVGGPSPAEGVPRRTGDQQVHHALLLYAVAALAYLAASSVRPGWLSGRRLTLALGSLGFVLLPLLNEEHDLGGRYWLRIGSLPQFAPWMFVRVALVLFCASYLAHYRELLDPLPRRGRLPRRALRYVMWLAAPPLACGAVLAFQSDVGAAFLIFLTLVGMTWCATGSRIFLTYSLAVFGVAFAMAYASIDHIHARVDAWLSPDLFSRTDDASRHLAELLFGLASGLWGAGLGAGQPYLIRPNPWSDSVASAWTEETGTVGIAAILGLELLVFLSGVRIGVSAPTLFLRLAAIGLALMPALETLMVAAGTARLLPYTAGVPAAFLAASGSSLVSNYILVGLLAVIDSFSGVVRERHRRLRQHALHHDVASPTPKAA